MKLTFTLGPMVLAVCIIAISWVAFRSPAKAPQMPDGPSMPQSILPPGKTAAELRAERDYFFKGDVEPSIKKADELNREAATRCVTRLKESFDGYRAGIKPFCQDVNSWGTRLGVITRMPSDWWYEKTNVSKFVEEKFGKHLFTDKKLKADIGNALAQFRKDVVANQNALVVEIRAAISSKDLPDVPEIKYSQFAADLSSRVTSCSTDSARNSVVNGIVTEIASGVGGIAAEQLLVQLIARLSTMAAASAATAGGTTAGGAAVGGGAGSIGGPIGIAAGLAVGLVVGGVIDWWMSSSFEANMTAQLNGMVDELTSEVIAGDVSRPGLRDALRGTCDLMRQAYQDSLRARIVDGETT